MGRRYSCTLDNIAICIFFAEHNISNKGVNHQNLLSLSFGKIIRKNIDSCDGLLPATFETYQIVEPGNIIFRFTDLQNDHKSLRVGLVNEEGIITSAYTCVQGNKETLPKFAFYMLHSYDIKRFLQTWWRNAPIFKL